MFIYFWQAECEQGMGRERGRQNPKQAPGSELSVQSLTRGLNLQTWPEVRRSTDWATQAPHFTFKSKSDINYW